MKRRDGVVFFCYSRNATPRGRISISGSYPRFPFLQNPAKFLFHLYLPLTPLFQSFFQFSPADLGGKNLLAAEFLPENFFAAEFSLSH
jgi:hypothetical protein